MRFMSVRFLVSAFFPGLCLEGIVKCKDLTTINLACAAAFCISAASSFAPTMTSPAGALTAHERLLAAVSAADALPRGTTFEKVKRARDRLRGEHFHSCGDELVKSSTNA